MTATLAPLNSRLSDDLRPPRPPRPMSEFAGTLLLPDGPSAGLRWVPASEPTQRAFYEVIESCLFRKFVVVAPSQRGKTLKAVLCPTLHAIAECRQSVAYVMPNLDKLTQNWTGKIEPAIIGTGYKDWLPVTGPGSKGGKPAVLTLRDPSTSLVAGRIYFMAMGTGPRETSLSSNTAQTVVCDEADDAESAGQLALVFKRSESFRGAGRGYVVSTVNRHALPGGGERSKVEHHPILALHAQGTRHRWHHLCSHCHDLGIPDFEHVNTEADCIACPRCGVHWSEADRTAALNGGAWRATVESPETAGVYSELTTGLDYHMASIPDICANIREAKKAEAMGDPSLMRTVMHKIFCRPYEAPLGAVAITNKGLAIASSLSDYDKRIVPHWVSHLCSGVDIQGDRLYWIVAGIGPDDRWCIVDWGYEMYVPKSETRHPTPGDQRRTLDELDAKFNAGWKKEGTEQIYCPLPGLRALDVGDNTDALVGWLRGVRGWRAVKGCGRDTIKHLGKVLELPPEAKHFVELRQPDGWPVPLCHVIGENVRRWIHSALLRKPYTPASGMLPRGLGSGESLLLHLSGEVWVEESEKGGKFVAGYWNDKAHPRHDFLDALIYAIALSRLRIGVQTVNAGRPVRKYGRIGNVGAKL